MTTIPTIALIIGAIIIFMLGGFVGIAIMALMNVAKEADKQIGADEGERRKQMREILFRGKQIDNGEWVEEADND